MDEVLYKLKKSFQRDLFERVIARYRGSLRTEKILGIPASSIRAYKNGYSRTIPRGILDRLVSEGILSQKEMERNTQEIQERSEIINSSLDKGRKYNHMKKERDKQNIPSIEKICKKEGLDFFMWFCKYFNLFNIGFRKARYEEGENSVLLKYQNYAAGQQRRFIRKIPKKFPLDREFSYFFGLWCGDKSGGKRFGIINQDKNILSFTESFLRKNFQEVEKVLYKEKNMEDPLRDYDKKVEIEGKFSGWAISVYSTNGVLVSFFNYLLRNVDFLLKNYLDRESFFAGLFDAEGNVSLYNLSLRWACKNNDLIPIYKKHLKKMSLYNKYDGANIVTQNKEIFFEKIFPHLKHDRKKNDVLFMIKGKEENLPLKLIKVLKYIKKNPYRKQKEIAKALKKSKVYFQLSLLKKFGFIESEGYPPKFKLNKEINRISGD